MKKIIINADDFGFTPGINAGIQYGFNQAILSSTTMMTNMEYIDHAMEIYAKTKMNVGVHLTITAHNPLLKHQYIVDSKGYFIKPKDYFQLTFTPEILQEIKDEFEAQIQKAYDLGINVTHLDTHHHTYCAYPALRELTFDLARKYHLPIRIDHKDLKVEDLPDDIGHTDHFINNFDMKMAELIENEEALNTYFEEITSQEGITEIMVHPAFVDRYLMTHSSMNMTRATSLAGLEKLKVFLENKGIELIDYSYLQK